MDDYDWLLSVEKVCDWLRIEPGVTGNFLLGHSGENFPIIQMIVKMSPKRQYLEIVS